MGRPSALLLLVGALVLIAAACSPASASEEAIVEPTPVRALIAVREDPAPPEPALALIELPTPAPATPAPAPSPSPRTIPTTPVPVARAEVTVPILMYHHVKDVPASSDDLILKDLSVPPIGFRKQVDMLVARGARTVSLDDVVDYLHGRQDPPPRAVVLTFDDGYDDTFTHAFPELRRAGMRATVFVISDFVGARGYMTWAQIRELAAAGWSVESHSITHPELRVLADAELNRQLRESRSTIQKELGLPVNYLSYPSGHYDKRVINAASLAGYRAAVTVNYGTKLRRLELFELPRVRVHGADTPDTLRAHMGW